MSHLLPEGLEVILSSEVQEAAKGIVEVDALVVQLGCKAHVQATLVVGRLDRGVGNQSIPASMYACVCKV